VRAEVLVTGALSGGHGVAAMTQSLSRGSREMRAAPLACLSTAGGLAFFVSAALAGALADAAPAPIGDHGSGLTALRPDLRRRDRRADGGCRAHLAGRAR
jgi:hypothetical protein